MKITSETLLPRFEFWAGAETNAALLTFSELVQLEDVLEELFPDGMTDTELNDLLWFDFDSVCEWLGLDVEEVETRA